MEKFKFAVFAVITLSLLAIFGYWSVTSLQSGTEYKNSQRVVQLEEENKTLKGEVDRLTNKISDMEAKANKPAPTVESTTDTELEATVIESSNKYQSLINELQKLVDKKVYLKLKSQGPSVGTVQKFLNIYNNTSNKVDNDYGATTKTAVAAFQKAEGLSADGAAGPGTFSKMIDWLKKQE